MSAGKPRIHDFERSLAECARAAQRFGEQVAQVAAAMALALAARKARRIARFGPRNLTGDGRWQSDMCAAWVHEACPADAWCDCLCHGGSLR